MRLCAPYRGADAHSVRVEFSGYALARDDLHISRLTTLWKSESPFALPMCYRELLAHNCGLHWRGRTASIPLNSNAIPVVRSVSWS